MEKEIIRHFLKGLREVADAEEAPAMEKYMKNIQPFLGAKRPAREQIYRSFKKKYGSYWRKEMTNAGFKEVVTSVWNGGYREDRYSAMFLIEYHSRFLNLENLDLFKSFIIEGSWWDTTDSLAQNAIGEVLRNHPDKLIPIMKEWTESDNLWVRRSSIISQLKSKAKTNTQLLEFVIDQLIDEDEFFIQKAIGWALREYSKTDPEWVRSYIDKNRNQLSNLAVREGSKYI